MSPERLAESMLAELRGIKCRCGAVKKPGQTFCRACYFLLTANQRRDLYKKINRGYQEAYIAAVVHLVAHVRFSLPLWLDPPTEPDPEDKLPWNVPAPREWCTTPGCLEAAGHAGECHEGFS